MAYGFETRDSNGNIGFSSEDSTWTLLNQFTAPAGSTDIRVIGNATNNRTITIGSCTEFRVTRHMLGQTVGDDEAQVHRFSNGNVNSGQGQLETVAATGSYPIRRRIYVHTGPSAADTVATSFMIFGR